VGPALGQHGVNIMEFCKGFNAQTGKEEGLILPVVVSIYQDRSFTFVVKTPPAAVLLKRAAGIAKASAVPAQGQDREGHQAAGARDRPDQAGRPQHRQRGRRDAHHRGHRPQAWALTSLGRRLMATMVSKRYDAALAKIAPDKQHSLEEAIGVLKAMPGAKFDESVDLSFRLGVGSQHADQMGARRGGAAARHRQDGAGGGVRQGREELEAREAGADVIGAEDLVEKVQGGFLDFDTTIATPDLMGQVGRLGKCSAPAASCRTRSRHRDLRHRRAVREAKAGKIEFRVTSRQHPHAGRQALVQRAEPARQCHGADRGHRRAPSRRRPRASTCAR